MLAHTKTLAAMTLAAAVFAAASLPAAADTFPDKDACLQKAFDLAGAAEQKGLSEDTLRTLDGMLEKLEGECVGDNFAAAAETAKQIEAEIGG